jgi:CubicO group peptidase (beta-lactamase class C family)
VTQRPLGELIRDEMALPLALGHFASCSDLREHSLSYVAASGTTTPVPAVDAGWLGGADTLCATTGDIARWWLAVRSGSHHLARVAAGVDNARRGWSATAPTRSSATVSAYNSEPGADTP